MLGGTGFCTRGYFPPVAHFWHQFWVKWRGVLFYLAEVVLMGLLTMLAFLGAMRVVSSGGEEWVVKGAVSYSRPQKRNRNTQM